MGAYMNRLETNDWLVLNNIIYKIYTTKDFNKMRSELLERLKLLLDFDSGDFFLSDENNHLCNPVTFNCEAKRTEIYDE